MKTFAFLHYGFKQPDQAMMAKWQGWFEKYADQTMQNIGFGDARRLSSNGIEQLGFNAESLTGISIIQAKNWSEAEAIARDNPFVDAIQIHEVRG